MYFSCFARGPRAHYAALGKRQKTEFSNVSLLTEFAVEGKNSDVINSFNVRTRIFFVLHAHLTENYNIKHKLNPERASKAL